MAVTCTRSSCKRWLFLLVVPLLHPVATLQAGDPDRPAASITRYDIATPEDLLLAHLVAPSMVGDIQQWWNQLLGGLPDQVGDWVKQFIDATAMANTITQAFPVEGQPALRPVDEVVADCARTLSVDKPDVYARNYPRPSFTPWRPAAGITLSSPALS
jgi:hypothetical protein